MMGEPIERCPRPHVRDLSVDANPIDSHRSGRRQVGRNRVVRIAETLRQQDVERLVERLRALLWLIRCPAAAEAQLAVEQEAHLRRPPLHRVGVILPNIVHGARPGEVLPGAPGVMDARDDQIAMT